VVAVGARAPGRASCPHALGCQGLLRDLGRGREVIWGWLGLYPITPGVVGFCPFYRAFKLNTVAPKHLKAGF
jgi:hypothetical protein